MKAILLAQSEITTVSSRKDGSIRFSVETGEMSEEQKAAFFQLQGVNSRILIEPSESEPEPPVEVKSDKFQKSPSVRLRNILYVYFQQEKIPGDFESFYKGRVEQMITDVRRKLDPA